MRRGGCPGGRFAFWVSRSGRVGFQFAGHWRDGFSFDFGTLRGDVWW